MLALFPVPGFWPHGDGRGDVLCEPQVKRKNIMNGLGD